MLEIDNDLIKAAKEGNEWAKAEIVFLLKKKVAAYANRYYLVGGERSDLMQEGYLGLCNALTEYNGSKGNFAAFALTCIDNQMKNSVKKNRTLKNKNLNDSLSLDTAGIEEGLVADSPETLYIIEENKTGLLKMIDGTLTMPEKEVVLLFVDGFNYKEIAEKIGKDTKAVDNALARARSKLSAVLKDAVK